MTIKQNSRKPLNSYAIYTGIALQMIIVILLGVYGGYKVDHWLDLKFPVFLLMFSLLSVGLAVYLAIKDFIKK